MNGALEIRFALFVCFVPWLWLIPDLGAWSAPYTSPVRTPEELKKYLRDLAWSKGERNDK
jgi:hypothetical protein